MSRSFFQNPITNFFLQTAQEHCVEHQELHPGYPLQHDLICVSLSDPVMHGSHVGGGMVGLSLVCIPEGVQNPVIEVLNGLVILLPEVLETDAESLS